MTVFEPSLEQVLAFCAEEPSERVFLEDVARRGYGRFSGVTGTFKSCGFTTTTFRHGYAVKVKYPMGGLPTCEYCLPVAISRLAQAEP